MSMDRFSCLLLSNTPSPNLHQHFFNCCHFRICFLDRCGYCLNNLLKHPLRLKGNRQLTQVSWNMYSTWNRFFVVVAFLHNSNGTAEIPNFGYVAGADWMWNLRRPYLNEIQKDDCVKIKLITLNWQRGTLKSLCQKKHEIHSSPVTDDIEGKTHKLLKKLKVASWNEVIFWHYFVKYF